MKIINFYGVPGTGKSTLAAWVFTYMKKKGLSVQLCTEYAKECVYAKKHFTLQDQIYLFAKMNHKLQSYQHYGIDYVVCDSPLLLNILYKHRNYMMNYVDNSIFEPFITGVNNTYQRLNFLVTKDSSFSYQLDGRMQTQIEAGGMHHKLVDLLIKHDQKYINIENKKDLDISYIINLIGDFINVVL